MIRRVSGKEPKSSSTYLLSNKLITLTLTKYDKTQERDLVVSLSLSSDTSFLFILTTGQLHLEVNLQ